VVEVPNSSKTYSYICTKRSRHKRIVKWLLSRTTSVNFLIYQTPFSGPITELYPYLALQKTDNRYLLTASRLIPTLIEYHLQPPFPALRITMKEASFLHLCAGRYPVRAFNGICSQTSPECGRDGNGKSGNGIERRLWDSDWFISFRTSSEDFNYLFHALLLPVLPMFLLRSPPNSTPGNVPCSRVVPAQSWGSNDDPSGPRLSATSLQGFAARQPCWFPALFSTWSPIQTKQIAEWQRDSF
jgi:hypothetical protein